MDITTLKKTPVSVFCIPSHLLQALRPVDQEPEVQEAVNELRQLTEESLGRLQIDKDHADEEDESKICGTCGINLPEIDHRKHYTTDWHRYNLKRKLVLGIDPVSEAEFDDMIEDLDVSISGSESSLEEDSEYNTDSDRVSTLVDKQRSAITTAEDQISRLPTVDTRRTLQKKAPSVAWYTAPDVCPPTYHFGVYRHLLTSRRPSVTALQRKGQAMQWTLLMMAGGHFAGAIVDVSASPLLAREVKILVHKTFHRYTTRRKQGGAQSANDNAKGKANSGGAMIRRYNEQALQQEVRELLSQWKHEIDKSELVFVHALGSNRRALLDYDGAVLTKNDERIKSIPFTTKRPTLNEIRRVYVELCTLKVIEVDQKELQDEEQTLAKRRDQEQYRQRKVAEALEKSTASVKTPKTQDTTATLHSELAKLVKQGKLGAVRALVKEHADLPVTGTLHTSAYSGHLPTLLHIASHHGYPLLVSMLIRELDADPTLRNESNRTAYEIAKDKPTRNAFRRCMCDLADKWSWLEGARVPSPLTKEQEEDMRAKEKERSEREAARQKQIAMERFKSIEQESEQESEASAKSASSSSGTLKDTMRMTYERSTASMSVEARLRLEREQRLRALERRIGRKL